MTENNTEKTNFTFYSNELFLYDCLNSWFHLGILIINVFVCLFGLIGNTLSFAVLHRSSKTNSSSYLMKVLALTDNAYLVMVIPTQIYPLSVSYPQHPHWDLVPGSFYSDLISGPIDHTIQFCTIWMVVLVTINRFIAVCKPLHAARLCSIRNVRLQMVGLFIFAVIYNIPRFLEFKLHLWEHPIYIILYEHIADGLFVFSIPLGLVIVLNVYLMLKLRRAQRLRTDMVDGVSAQENNITKVVVILILVFIICETPGAINRLVYYQLDDASKYDCSPFDRFEHISFILSITNSSVNFAIYCLFRRKFRKELRSLILCKDK